MRIQVGYEIAFLLPQQTASVVLLYIHPSRTSTLHSPERFEVDPLVPVSTFIDSFGNRCGRILFPAGRITLRYQAVLNDAGQPDPQVWNAAQHNVEDLPSDVLRFLMASRYCEVDSELNNLAGSLFNATPPGWPRVQDD